MAKRTKAADRAAADVTGREDAPGAEVAPPPPAEDRALSTAAESGPDSPAAGIDPDDDRAERFAAALGLTFKNPALLVLALTHRSVLSEWVLAGLPETGFQSNERLEFLGDALLGALAADYLYRTEPAASEGELTARRVSLVRAETLVRWAREIGLGEALYLAQGEKVTSGARDRILAGAFEALVGAIYLDRGLPAARRFFDRFLLREVPALGSPAEANPKGHLQEVLQERHRRSPSYVVAALTGPAHARVFAVEVRLDGVVLGTGSGSSKREAEQTAARAALARLGGGDGGAEGRRDGETGRRGNGETTSNAVGSGSGEDGAEDGAAVVPPSPSDRRGGSEASGRVRAARSGRRRAG